MYTFSKYHCIIALILIHVACASSTHSYEQSSYFIFDIIESAEAEPTKGRLAIPAEAFAQAKTKSARAEEVERSEFEIDFKQTIQPKTSLDSAFELDTKAKIEPITKPTRFRTQAFDSERSESVIGE